MKKNIVAFMLFISLAGYAQNPYGYSVEKLQGGTCDLSQFNGKKILVAYFNAASPDTTFLKKLDSLYRLNSERLALIGIPLNDIDGAASDSSLARALLDDLNLSFVVSKGVKGRKTSGIEQSLLAKWLTHGSGNGHFNSDIIVDGQMFIISEQGTLFGLFRKNTPSFILSKALDR